MATPLIEQTSFSSTNPDEVRQFFAEAYGENNLTVKHPLVDDGVLSVDQWAAPRISLSEVANPAELEIEFTGMDDQVVIATLDNGYSGIDHHGWNGLGVVEIGPGDVMLSIQPDVVWTHLPKAHLNKSIGLSESLLREVAGANPQDTNTHWEPLSTLPIPGRAQFWRDITRFLERTLTDPVAAESPLVVSEAERLVASAALTVFPNKLIERMRARDHEGGSDILRRAIAFIESNPQMDISLAEIAAAAHAGPRAVQVAFRKHMDTTPMAYLRLVRLHHVREDLLRSTPADGTTVAGVCARWGFGNQGRAAELYRTQFGENPSETLRR